MRRAHHLKIEGAISDFVAAEILRRHRPRQGEDQTRDNKTPGRDDDAVRTFPSADRELHIRRISTAGSRGMWCTIHATANRAQRSNGARRRLIPQDMCCASRDRHGGLRRAELTSMSRGLLSTSRDQPRPPMSRRTQRHVRYDTPLRSRRPTISGGCDLSRSNSPPAWMMSREATGVSVTNRCDFSKIILQNGLIPEVVCTTFP